MFIYFSFHFVCNIHSGLLWRFSTQSLCKLFETSVSETMYEHVRKCPAAFNAGAWGRVCVCLLELAFSADLYGIFILLSAIMDMQRYTRLSHKHICCSQHLVKKTQQSPYCNFCVMYCLLCFLRQLFSLVEYISSRKHPAVCEQQLQ